MHEDEGCSSSRTSSGGFSASLSSPFARSSSLSMRFLYSMSLMLPDTACLSLVCMAAWKSSDCCAAGQRTARQGHRHGVVVSVGSSSEHMALLRPRQQPGRVLAAQLLPHLLLLLLRGLLLPHAVKGDLLHHLRGATRHAGRVICAAPPAPKSPCERPDAARRQLTDSPCSTCTTARTCTVTESPATSLAAAPNRAQFLRS